MVGSVETQSLIAQALSVVNTDPLVLLLREDSEVLAWGCKAEPPQPASIHRSRAPMSSGTLVRPCGTQGAAHRDLAGTARRAGTNKTI